jgi:predicted TPR repeat methyltransferase
VDGARSREDSEKRYDEWASTYDKDLQESWDYRLPAFTGDLLIKYVKSCDARILDAGAGTGLSGEYLYQRGYQNLVGIDMSQGMLDKAGCKGIYQKLERMVLGEKLSYPDSHFDAVLSVGTIGYAPPESFDELIRITKHRGFIIFSIREAFYNEPRFRTKFQSLEEVGKWRLVEETAPFLGLPGEADNVYHYGFVYEVL